MVANLITISRIFLLVAVFASLSRDDMGGHLTGFILTIVLIALDGVDGMVARLLNQESQFGSVLDIVVDRIVENSFWIYFAVKGILPFWFPMLVVSRGFLTDGIRSVALARGMTPFGSATLHKKRFGLILVSSRFSRGLYGVVKVLSFLFLIIIESLRYEKSGLMLTADTVQTISWIGYGTVYFTLFFCLLRGIPVLTESRSFFTPGSEK